MQSEGTFDYLPIWALFVITLVLVLLAVEVGYRVGRFRRTSTADEKETPVEGMVQASLGVLALLLAFTFGVAVSRFDTRRGIVVDEANAIGTTYLRAAMIPERREEVRALLREYVAARLDAVRSGTVEHGMRRSDQLHAQLWANAVALGEKHPTSIVVGLFIQSLNEMIDVHARRLWAGLRSRIPGVVWAALYVVATLSLAAMGYHAGLTGTRRPLAIVAVALTFSVVIWVIADLDRPVEGLIRVNQQALIDLQESMTAQP